MDITSGTFDPFVVVLYGLSRTELNGMRGEAEGLSDTGRYKVRIEAGEHGVAAGSDRVILVKPENCRRDEPYTTVMRDVREPHVRENRFCDRNEEPLIVLATRRGDEAMVRAWLAVGGDVDACGTWTESEDKYERRYRGLIPAKEWTMDSALFAAAREGRHDLFTLLLEHGADEKHSSCLRCDEFWDLFEPSSGTCATQHRAIAPRDGPLHRLFTAARGRFGPRARRTLVAALCAQHRRFRADARLPGALWQSHVLPFLDSDHWKTVCHPYGGVELDEPPRPPAPKRRGGGPAPPGLVLWLTKAYFWCETAEEWATMQRCCARVVLRRRALATTDAEATSPDSWGSERVPWRPTDERGAPRPAARGGLRVARADAPDYAGHEPPWRGPWADSSHLFDRLAQVSWCFLLFDEDRWESADKAVRRQVPVELPEYKTLMREEARCEQEAEREMREALHKAAEGLTACTRGMLTCGDCDREMGSCFFQKKAKPGKRRRCRRCSSGHIPHAGCAWCRLHIDTWRRRTPEERKRVGQFEVALTPPSRSGRQVCRFFSTPRGCRNGMMCRFFHPGAHEPTASY